MNRNCKGCGRYLPSLRSQARGYGPKCLARKRRALAADFKPVQLEKAAKLRASRALTRVKPGVYRVRSGDNTYLTAKNACNCASGRYRPRAGSCFHQLAVSQEDA